MGGGHEKGPSAVLPSTASLRRTPKYASARRFLTRLASGTFLTGLRIGFFNTLFRPKPLDAKRSCYQEGPDSTPQIHECKYYYRMVPATTRKTTGFQRKNYWFSGDFMSLWGLKTEITFDPSYSQLI